MTPVQTRIVAPAAVPIEAPQGAAVAAQAGASPEQIYQAARAVRDEAMRAQAQISEQRRAVAERIRSGGAAAGADLDGLNSRLALLDKQYIASLENVAQANAAVQRAAAVPGAVQPDWGDNIEHNGPPDAFYALSALFIIAVLLPVSIAIAKRIWRRGTAAAMSIPRDVVERLNRIEESVDSIAIELERVGEGQRFVTNMFIESGAPQMLAAGGMESIEMKARERVEIAKAQ